MNKKLLSLAVAAGLASSSASAVDLNAVPQVPATIASETVIASTGTTLTNAGGILNVTVNAGFSISDGTARYMRFDFTGATFGAALTNASLAVDDSGGVAAASEVLSTGGAAKGNSVVFEVTASAGKTVGVTNDAILTLPNMTLAAQGNIGVTYQLFDNAVDAVNNAAGKALVTTAGTVAQFAAANTTAATGAVAVTPAKIDVTLGTKRFVSGTTGTLLNPIGTWTTTDRAAGAPLALDGATAVTTANVQTAAKLTVSGDFSFTQDLTNNAPDGTYTPAKVFIDNVAPFDCAASNIAATTLTATAATFAVGPMGTGVQGVVCVTANGVSTIPEASFTGVYAPTETAVAPGPFSDPDTNLTFATLSKNGSSVSLNLALAPAGAFSNFVRINNTSNITGDVFIQVINDDGKSVTINLADVAGQSTSALVGQASTGLLTIQSIYDAAVAKDATFALGTTNKLRLVVNGEFSTIDAQSISVSTDSTTFTTF